MIQKWKIGEQGEMVNEESEDPKTRWQDFQKEKMHAEIFKEIILEISRS